MFDLKQSPMQVIRMQN